MTRSLSPWLARRCRDAATAMTLLSATMLTLSTLGVFTVQALPAGTSATPGMTLSPASGSSSTAFSLALTAPNNACPGDSATDGYRWQTYVVPASTDPATLTYTSSGPATPAFSLLASTGGAPVVNKLLSADPKGMIIGTQTMSFAQFPPGTLAQGAYKIGIACTKAGVTERFWTTDFFVTTSTSGGPSQFLWSNTPAVTTTTTTTTVAPTTTTSTTVSPTSTTTSTTVAPTTSTTVAPTTSTTVAPTTSTTVAPTTSTTVSPSTSVAATSTSAAVTTTTKATTTTLAATTTTTKVTTTTLASTTTTAPGATTTTTTTIAGATTTTVAVASFAASGTGGSGSGSSASALGGTTSLPVTGSNHILGMVFWSLMLMVFGRMVVMLSRPTRTRT